VGQNSHHKMDGSANGGQTQKQKQTGKVEGTSTLTWGKAKGLESNLQLAILRSFFKWGWSNVRAFKLGKERMQPTEGKGGFPFTV